MALKSAPYYWVECDNCGIRCDYDDYAAWSDDGQAIDEAVTRDWSHHGDRDHCPACPPLCETCREEAGEESADRDDLCQSCWEKAEAEEAKHEAIRAGKPSAEAVTSDA
jgi:hypothetical protein